MGDSERQEAERLEREWEQRSLSRFRDFFVASHAGWDEPEHWARRAQNDVDTFLHEVDRERLAGFEVLEAGCGVGRLAGPLSSLIRGYTGFDVAGGMVAEARARCAEFANVRFFKSDGLSVPAEACDRAYDLALVVAVFIHCPKSVIASLVKSIYAQLAPGGQLRFQVRADVEDTDGIVQLEAALEHARIASREPKLHPEVVALAAPEEYMGHVFHYREVEPFLTELTGAAVRLIRVDLAHIYGWIERPA